MFPKLVFQLLMTSRHTTRVAQVCVYSMSVKTRFSKLVNSNNQNKIQRAFASCRSRAPPAKSLTISKSPQPSCHVGHSRPITSAPSRHITVYRVTFTSSSRVGCGRCRQRHVAETASESSAETVAASAAEYVAETVAASVEESGTETDAETVEVGSGWPEPGASPADWPRTPPCPRV